MGIEKFMIASSLVGVVAQRLVRKVCPECSTEVDTTPEQRAIIGDDCRKIRKAVGCRNCNFTGYRSRTAVHEILFIDKTIRKMVSDGANADDLKDYAIKNLGLIPLNQSIKELVKSGVISFEEYVKASYNF